MMIGVRVTLVAPPIGPVLLTTANAVTLERFALVVAK
jgi:hypothetical protein